MATLLVIDNYDSFTFNLVQMFRLYDLDIKVFRSDKISVRQVRIIDPDYIMVSPGPKDPAHAGISIPLIRAFYKEKPLLGVCLGMQCINEAFGGETRRSPVPVHGKTSAVTHDGTGLFAGIPSPFNVARYHSLMIRPADGQTDLQVNATCEGDVIMGVSHADYPLFGVQFHPESFLTEYGFHMIENFLRRGPLRTGFRYTGDVVDGGGEGGEP
jgi:anthranilate synthase component 2